MKRGWILGIILSVGSMAAIAQVLSPYAGQHTRDIKALSQQEIMDYLDGKGMGYAKVAELNHYPGPRHVLDLADSLALTPDQQKETEQLFNAMQTKAQALGAELVTKEAELDQKFAAGKLTAEELEILLQSIGELEAKLRYVHLSTHLQQKSLLSQHQVMMYDQLRGYAGGGHSQGQHHGH